MRSRSRRKAGAKTKSTISLSAETLFHLDVLAAHEARSRGRKISRSALVEELLAPHLGRVVVSIRASADAPVERVA